MANDPETISIDGAEYRYADLSEEALRQVHNVSTVDAEIRRLEQRLALQQTARNLYVHTLGRALAESENPRTTH